VRLLFLSHSAPGGGTLDGEHGALSMSLMVIGLLSTIVFFVTLIVALVQLLVDLLGRGNKIHEHIHE
jgi:hypothetical protein